MEIKKWTYEEFPEFTEEVEGAERISTTGEEMGVRLHLDVEYARKDGEILHLQILEPYCRNDAGKTYPCLLYVQGSAWFKQNVYAGIPLLTNLAKKGYVIAVVEYRHSGIAAFPAQIQDARDAVRFMKIHGGEYHADLENVFVGGSSSGGHTAVFAGMLSEGDPLDVSSYPGVSADVKGILDYYGAVDFLLEDGYPSTENHHQPDSPEGRLLGGTSWAENPRGYEEATAITHISEETQIPPVLIFHGTKDRTLNIRQSIRLYEKLKACKKDAMLYLIEGADHGGAEFWTEEVCGRADAFMKYCMEQ